MIPDRRVVTDVISRPQYRVAADFDVRLNDVIFHDERVRLQFEVGPNDGPGADMPDKGIPFLFGFSDLHFASFVYFSKTNGHIHLHYARRIMLRDFLEGDYRQAQVSRLFHVLGIDGERHHASIAFMVDVILNHLGNFTDAKYYNVS